MPPTRMPQPSGLLRTSSELVLFFGCCNASVRDLTLIKRSDNFFRTCSESVVRRARPYAGWRIDADNKCISGAGMTCQKTLPQATGCGGRCIAFELERGTLRGGVRQAI